MKNTRFVHKNPCPKPWEEMQNDPCGKFCDSCKTKVHDLTNLSLQEIHQNHVGKGKCVKLNNEQIRYFNLLRPIKNIAVAASIVAGTSILNTTYAQNATPTEQNVDSCTVTGILVDQHKKVCNLRSVFFRIDGITYETKTDKTGRFEITLPQHCKIEEHNIKKIKRIKGQKHINLGTIKVKVLHYSVGSF